jgi:SAM-dependent methyltransferase
MRDQDSSPNDIKKALAAKHNLAVLEEGQIATQNKRGMQMAVRSPLFAQWIASAQNSSYPLADIGCAYGINAIEAVHLGISVIGIDLGEEHFPYLRDLYASVTAESNTRLGSLTLQVGSITEALPIADASLAGILLAEVLHFIPGDSAQAVFDQFYRKLVPGGILCLHCALAEGISNWPLGHLITAELEKRRALGLRWPGELSNFHTLMADEMVPLDIPDNARPDFFHLFTKDQVGEFARNAGFQIITLEAGEHPGYPTFMRTASSNLQLVAQRLPL